jgi:hypothetical protein
VGATKNSQMWGMWLQTHVKPTHDFFESAPFMYTADDAERSAKIVNFVMHF